MKGLNEAIRSAKVPVFRELRSTTYETSEGPETQNELLIQDPDGYLLRFIEASECEKGFDSTDT